MQDGIGARVQSQIQKLAPGRTQKEIATAVGMTDDALSRALRGQRGFASIELARIADLIGADLHWLITGESDPQQLRIAARHDYDFATGRRDVPGRADDKDVLRNIELAYRQGYGNNIPKSPSVHAHPRDIREELGSGFVRTFANDIERVLDIDVVRVPELSTSYCLGIDGRLVIVIAATGNWFWENFSIAHELGHIAAGHLDVIEDDSDVGIIEQQANGFAADLLLPADLIRSLNWTDISAEELARRVWDFGVSTEALVRRLIALRVNFDEWIPQWATKTTQRLLRHHWVGPGRPGDDITRRMDEASCRRFPIALQDAHLARIEAGQIGKATLAWMLGTDAERLEVDSPTITDVSDDELSEALA